MTAPRDYESGLVGLAEPESWYEQPAETTLETLDEATTGEQPEAWFERPASGEQPGLELEQPQSWFEQPETYALDTESQTDEAEELESGLGEGEADGPARLLLFESAVGLETGAGSSLTDRVMGVAAFTLGPTLRRGSSGPAVAALQRALVTLGQDIAVDGAFGPNTERAVRAFQRSAGITADGIVGPQTKSAIVAALARRGQAPGPVPVPPTPQPTGTALCDAIARVAEAEFQRWHPVGGAALRETDPAATPILQQYYREGVGVQVTAQQLQSQAWQQQHPWSAVFVSWVMRTAGAGNAFHYARAHQAYIRAARRNRLDSNVSNPFWAYRPTEVAPQVGDLICASRANSGATYDNIADAQVRPTHCDIVTRVSPGQLRVIGGNVNQNVDTKRPVRTLPDGRLALDGNQARYFAVVRCRGSASSAPIPPQPTPGGMNARVLRVMELLVNQYGYPVNAAAGIVGNLMAESAVQPNRVEGSRPDTPMRSRNFAGQVVDFTADQIMNRNASAGVGPRLPGIGIAQWTSADRRRGLFRHSFQGSQLGAAILFDLGAQVDYLVRELRTRPINGFLTNPGVTVNDAADEVVYRFEVPGAVLLNGRLRPRTDPSVQRVFAARRALANQALATFRAGHP
jgi:peptidoglycan hydrolase-like protein with peptidoglycan-binding domain